MSWLSSIWGGEVTDAWPGSAFAALAGTCDTTTELEDSWFWQMPLVCQLWASKELYFNYLKRLIEDTG